MNALLLQDAGIGSDMQSVDDRLANLITMAGESKHSEVADEATNLRYTFFSMLNGIDYKSKSFACLIHSIDGYPIDDSEEGLSRAVDALKEMTYQELEDHFDEIKKNLILN